LTGKDLSAHSTLEEENKLSLRYFLLKMIFMPMLITFFYANVQGLYFYIINYSKALSEEESFRIIFLGLVSFILLIDTAFFVIGYSFEFTRSKIRSVDSTFFGWLVALMCYPPFNDVTSRYFTWGSADYAFYGTLGNTKIILGIAVILMAIYSLASVALGPRASNLTNRGIVSWGPYKYVRHPAYICKNLFWLILAIPSMNFHTTQLFPYFSAISFVIISILIWFFIYYLRALTEEKHLLQDRDYQEYCKKVKYRFIPGIY